ncbi:MAG: glycerol-3-phosphate dehydrogenase, partial [Deltaproteobacteria bacterium]|nr:glycerol-3-phosphate dehydrogenase [Deltaproteobacteria bacterium]
GPTLSEELMAGNPAGATVASHFDEVLRKTQSLFAGCPLRLYGGRDVIGTEIGGAFKNVIALMAGAAHGLGFGDNTKALIVTRGLYEMSLYGAALGAEPATFTGLAGIGDLMATCSSTLSRNFRTGIRFAKGEALEGILSASSQVVEGVPATRAIHEQSLQLGLNLPMVRAVYGAFFEGLQVQDLLHQLMERQPGRENSLSKGAA